MKKEIFSIYDKIAQIYHNPVYLINKGIAIRQAQDQFKNPDSEIAQHPEDFILFHIGTFEDTTAKITMLEIPETVLKFWEIQEDVSNVPTPDLSAIPKAQAI